MTAKGIVTFMVLAVAPLIPLVTTWRRFIKEDLAEAPDSITQVRIETTVITISFVLLLVGLIWSPALGPDYSKRRLTVIYANLVLTALVALAAAFGPRRFKRPLATSGFIVALGWAYLALVSSVV
ncbi:MAG: hypothetical protein WBX22_07400 [Silvibacterium sp.]